MLEKITSEVTLQEQPPKHLQSLIALIVARFALIVSFMVALTAASCPDPFLTSSEQSPYVHPSVGF